MPYFKDADNNVFWLDEGDDPNIWMIGREPITDEEAKTIIDALHQEWLATQPTKEEQIAKLQEQIDALKVQP
jgi:ribose 5-phosphate isomerase RpiB